MTERPATPVTRAGRIAASDFQASLVLFAAMVVLALIGLAAQGNWPKVLRVAVSFAAYAVVLLGITRARVTTPPYWVFAAAGATAGLASGLVRVERSTAATIALVVGGALLIGGMHWLALHAMRAGFGDSRR